MQYLLIRGCCVMWLTIAACLCGGCFYAPKKVSPPSAVVSLHMRATTVGGPTSADFRSTSATLPIGQFILPTVSITRADVESVLGRPTLCTTNSEAVGYEFAAEQGTWIAPLAFKTVKVYTQYMLRVNYDNAGRVERYMLRCEPTDTQGSWFDGGVRRFPYWYTDPDLLSASDQGASVVKRVP
jgi:hypothetical protein